jgi:hypothetical protein
MPEKDIEIQIPIEHQKIVLDRIKNTKEEDFLKWDDVKHKFTTATDKRNTLNETARK